MTFDPVPLAVLENARGQLIQQINRDLTAAERELLLSMKRLEPKWELLGIPSLERLPGLQWKLYNLRKMARQNATQPNSYSEQSSDCERHFPQVSQGARFWFVGSPVLLAVNGQEIGYIEVVGPVPSPDVRRRLGISRMQM